MKTKQFFRHILIFSALIVLFPVAVYAQNSSSSSYQVFEAQFGSGGIDEQCSGGQFCAQGSLGGNAVGRQSSANFDAEAGVLTQNQEFLEFAILSTSVELGEIDPSTTGTGTLDFYIRAYLSSGYTVYSAGSPPSIGGGEELDALTAGDTSQQGIEQFGINLVDNTSPDIGTTFSNVPDGTFADGAIAAGYDTVDTFRYNDGEAIVQAPGTPGNQGTGQTNYTISYIANSAVLTPAGTYVMQHNLIAVPTF